MMLFVALGILSLKLVHLGTILEPYHFSTSSPIQRTAGNSVLLGQLQDLHYPEAIQKQ